MRRVGAAVASGVFLLVTAVALEGQAELQTASETSGFARHTSYVEMMEYLEVLRASSSEFRLGIYGETRQGRELPYLVFSRPAVTRGWEAAALGKPVVEIHANVHGGERTHRESLLILARRLGTPGTPENALLDDLVIIVSPQINPDGFEATPSGTRGNAWGIDLNRDYMKLEHPSIHSWVQNVFQEWNPHLFVDGHNGGSFPYHLNYQCPGHADPDQSLTEICSEEIFPRIDERLEAEEFRSFYYARGDEDGWYVGGTDARISRNYAGFANSIGILFEAPGWQTLEDGVEAGILGYLAVLEYVRDNADRVMEIVKRARRDAILLGSEPRGEVVVEMKQQAADRRVSYLIGEGEGDERRIVEVHDAPIYMKPAPTRTRTRPYAYLLPRDAEDAVALLRRHNVAVEVLRDSITLEVQGYPLKGVAYEEAYNHRAATKVEVEDPVTVERSFPAGTYVVPTGQMMGRVATHLLEPETSDNLIYWGRMDPWLPLAELEAASEDPVMVPLYRLMAPAALPARLVH